jgi:hypothetical protein
MRLLVAFILVFFVSWSQPSVSQQQAEKLAKEKIVEIVKEGALPAGIEQANTTVERHGENYLVDFKDERLNLWVVVTVHPNGQTEVSKTPIK